MTIETATVHCSDTPNGLRINIEAMTKDHIAKGFGGPAYHILIQPDGEKVMLRGLNEKGSHVAGHNTGNIGICLAGKDKFSLAQFNAMATFLDDLRRLFNFPAYGLHCHYEWDTAQKKGKTCPNIDAKKLLVWYLSGDPRIITEYLIKKG